jgi:hypothetical protein
MSTLVLIPSYFLSLTICTVYFCSHGIYIVSTIHHFALLGTCIYIIVVDI